MILFDILFWHLFELYIIWVLFYYLFITLNIVLWIYLFKAFFKKSEVLVLINVSYCSLSLLRLLEKQNALHLPVFSIFVYISAPFPEYWRIWNKTRMHWLDRPIVRKQLDIMSTYHYVQNQGKLMMQSRENGQKPFKWSNIFKLEFFLKNRFHLNWTSYLVLTSGQKPTKSLELFLRKISKSLILG